MQGSPAGTPQQGGRQGSGHSGTSGHPSVATWSLLPEMGDDHPRLLEIVAEVERRWGPLDKRRFLLTGISDGGTFTWLAGLRGRSIWTHLAPIIPGPAFGFPAIAALLKLSATTRTTFHGKPIYLVSATHDHLFRIDMAREVAQAVASAGALLTFCEKTDMGHTHPREEPIKILDWLFRVDRTSPDTTLQPHTDNVSVVGIEQVYEALRALRPVRN